jgi:methionyl-tRNA formyltransferase
LRLAFMGTPDFAVPALQALLASGHAVVAAYSQPPRPAGRGQKLRPSPVQQAAEAAGIAVRTPTSLKEAGELAHWQSLGLDAAVVVAYGLLLPPAFLEAPRLGCLNIHASLLPRWRGAAPIHRAIMAGDTETGVSIMQMAPGLDTGPVLAERRLAIAPDATTARLHDALAQMGAGLIVETLDRLAQGPISPTPQTQAGITYAAKIDKAEARIDWSRPAAEIDRQVRGLCPFPGAWFTLDGARLKVLAGQIVDAAGAPGCILDRNTLTIACGGAAYRPTKVQREGKGAMAVADFLRGAALTVNQVD